jgi:hypothetical protein
MKAKDRAKYVKKKSDTRRGRNNKRNNLSINALSEEDMNTVREEETICTSSENVNIININIKVNHR